MWAYARLRATIIVCSLFFLVPRAHAQDEKPKFWESDAAAGVRASLAIVGQGDFFGAIGVRVLCSIDATVGRLDNDDIENPRNWKFSFKEPLPIDRAYLDKIKDFRPIPMLPKSKSLPDSWKYGGVDWSWYVARSAALDRTADADLGMFKTAAKTNEDVDFLTLKNTPSRYRGKIVTVTGKLTSLKKQTAPAFVDNVAEIYVGTISGPLIGAPAYTVVFIEAPEKIEPGDKLDLHVTFHGYFLSLVTYPGDKKDKEDKKQADVLSAYLVGRTLEIHLPDAPLPINPVYLEPIKDGRPLPNLDMGPGKIVMKDVPDFWAKPGEADWGWYMAFNDALRRSNEADLDLFKKAAAENAQVLYPDLRKTPHQYRGKIITVTGKLTHLRLSKDAPRYYHKPVYTGAIVGPTPGAPPFAVAMTELPEGVKPFEKGSVPVTFHGYFLSIVRFEGDKAKKQEDVLCPYLVGKTFTVTPAGEEDKTASNYYLILGTLIGFVLVAVIVAALNVWFRRGDRAIQARLAAMRDKSQPFNVEPADPGATTPIADTGIKADEGPKDASSPPG